MFEDWKDHNYWAVILGGSSGLGLATAHKLAKHGMNICLVHRDRRSTLNVIEKEFAQIRATGAGLMTFNVDALKEDKRIAIVENLKEKMKEGGRIKLLLHSIAKGNLKSMVSEEEAILQNDDFHLTLDAMAISLYDWVQHIFQKNLFTEDARVISFTSEGNKKAWRNYAAVSAAKAALEAITRNIALEFAPWGIRANCIQAGMTDTSSFRLIPGSESLKSHALMRNPSGRMTLPEDVANVVFLLCQKEAAWINGAIIPVDGGEHIS